MSFIIKEVIIQDFRSHANTHVVFDDGINLISGRNGAGKTSILEAILVALYGSRAAKLSKSELVRNGAAKFTITLKFLLNGKEYTIVRNSDGGSKLSGEVHLEGDSQINAWVEKHIAPSHVFLSAIYVRQGEIDAIIRDDESRERVIRRVTRIDDYENAWRNLGVIIKMFQNEATNYRQFAVQEEELRKREEEKKAELNDRLQELKDCESRVNELAAEVEKLEGEKRKLDELGSKLSDLRLKLEREAGELRKEEARLSNLIRQKEEIAASIERLEAEVKRYEELHATAKRYELIENVFKEASKKLDEIGKREQDLRDRRQEFVGELKKVESDISKLKEVEDELRRLEEKLNEYRSYADAWENIKAKVDRLKQLESRMGDYSLEKIEKMFSALQKAREEYRKLLEAFEKLASRRSELKTKKKQIEKAIAELQVARGSCPVCGRVLDDSHRNELLRKYRLEIEKIAEKLKELEVVAEKLESKKEKVEMALKKQDIIVRLKQFAEEVQKLKKEVEAVNTAELEAKYGEFIRLKDAYERLKGQAAFVSRSAARREEIRKAIEEIDDELRRIEEEKEKVSRVIRELGYETLEEVQKELEKLKNDYIEWLQLKNSAKKLEDEKEKMSAVEREIETVMKSIEEKKRTVSEITDRISEIERVYSVDEHSRVTEEFMKKSAELTRLKERVKLLLNNVESIKKDIDYIRGQIESVAEYKRKADVIERKILPELTKIREKFRKYRNMVAEAALKEVESYASEIFEEFTEGKYAGIRLRQVVEKKEKLKVFVIHQGEERDIGFLSGGELVAMGLAFRLALAMFMVRGNLPLLILDEPTPFLDEERRRKLVDITTSYLRRIPQVIVVSHDDELKDAADRVITVEYAGGVSKVGYVEA